MFPETRAAELDAISGALADASRAASARRRADQQLLETIKLPSGPKMLADMTKLQFIWMILCDQIHHRGQFSIYLRTADGKVPSIYGPTAEEPGSKDVYRLPSTVYRLPSTVYRLPSTVYGTR
jgi:uncharacterized damage-inducible protein DinB